MWTELQNSFHVCRDQRGDEQKVWMMFKVQSEKQKNDFILQPEACYYDVFIRATLGRYLPECLQMVSEVKPADPIEYIAHWLYKAYDSDMYYRAKVAYLREIHQLGEIMKREKQEHEDKVAPFMQAMQAERWNYFASLHAELEALGEIMAQVDTEVDEGTKLRFLEVQLLISEERDFVKQGYLTPLAGNKESEKLVEEETDTPKPNSPFPASVRSSLQVIEETKSVVMIETPAAEDTEDGRRARRRLSPIPRLGRRLRHPGNQIELSTSGLLSVEPAQAPDILRIYASRDLTNDHDAARRLLSIPNRDGEEGDLKQMRRPGESSQATPTRKQQIDAKCATMRCFDATMRHSDVEDSEMQSCEIDGESSGSSVSVSSLVSKYSPAEISPLPAITAQGKQSKEKLITSSPCDREHNFSKTAQRQARYWLPRQVIQSPHEIIDLDHQAGVDEVPEDTHISRTPTKDDCQRFHLPPVRTQRGTSGAELVHEYERFSEELGRDLSRRAEYSDQVVRLPAIRTDKQKTGTLVMTNSGHVAFVNKELGVIAPNALKIRNVHPIDKPEMWARQNFQPQSFYDHELYTETDQALVEGEDDERCYSLVFRMALDDSLELPYRNWKKPKDDESF